MGTHDRRMNLEVFRNWGMIYEDWVHPPSSLWDFGGHEVQVQGTGYKAQIRKTHLLLHPKGFGGYDVYELRCSPQTQTKEAKYA